MKNTRVKEMEALIPLLKKLNQCCVALGNDITAIQGAGGNVSLKDRDTLYIKASGTCLSQALEKNIFVSVSRLAVLDMVNAGESDFSKLVPPNTLRPSIETPLHALMKQQVVIHAHCIHTIARTVAGTTEQKFQALLEGYSCVLIPYCKPGLPLSLAAQKRLYTQPNCNVVILQNHGIVVGGDSIEGAFAMLNDVRHKLTVQATGDVSYFDRDQLISKNDCDWAVPEDDILPSLAMNKTSLRVACAGALYPDHVVFLGGIIPIAKSEELLSQTLLRLKQADFNPCYVIFPHIGVLVSPTMTEAQMAMLKAFALVCERVPEDAPVMPLKPEDIAELLHWDAEKYRQKRMQSGV